MKTKDQSPNYHKEKLITNNITNCSIINEIVKQTNKQNKNAYTSITTITWRLSKIIRSQITLSSYQK